MRFLFTLFILLFSTLAFSQKKWDVKIIASNVADQEKIKTWNDVFKIEQQYNEAIEVFHKTFIEDLAHKNNLKGQRLTVARLKQELRKYRDNGIGNPKLETMAKLKFVWANYHINITDNSQLAVIVQEIIVLKTRVRP